jgi:hypothetical protein
MRIVFIVLASIVLALHVPVAYGAETLVCDYKEKFRDGGWREAGVTLTLQGNAVTGISYHNAIASGKEGGGYVCAFDASVSDGNSTWTRQNGLTLVELKNDKKSTFEIRKSKKGFTIRFLEMSSEYCGFGAEFPESVGLDRGKKGCRVKY